MSADGAGEKPLVVSLALDALPVYSPDGRKLAFVSERTAKYDRRVYIADADGRNIHRLPVAAGRGRWQTNPSWGVRPQGDPCTIEGTIGNDTLVGTTGADVICGGSGNDVIRGGGGPDTLLGGTGNDRIEARDRERDVVDGGKGRDAARLDRKLDVPRNVEVKIY